MKILQFVEYFLHIFGTFFEKVFPPPKKILATPMLGPRTSAGIFGSNLLKMPYLSQILHKGTKSLIKEVPNLDNISNPKRIALEMFANLSSQRKIPHPFSSIETSSISASII